MTYNIGRTLNT